MRDHIAADELHVRQALGPRAPPCNVDHLLRQVDADDRAARRQEAGDVQRHATGAAADVQHVLIGLDVERADRRAAVAAQQLVVPIGVRGPVLPRA
jgi:hypothetical protein